jgi:hypothetical protein
MRWIVDVSSLEGAQSPGQSYCVEAESWQGALQSARRLRGDESRMAGFSIDITNDGCKAVDPAKKLRYEVKRTTDDTPLTPGGETAPPARRRSGNPPRPSSSAPRADATMKMNAPPSNMALPENGPSVAKAPPVSAPRPAPAPAPAPIAVPPILVSREQEPTAEVPLTYREYGFALAPGTTEDAAANALLQQLTRIQGVLAAAPAGKLVNLAAFDQMFQGRPTVLPLATLTWKDWKPEPAVSFPRRARPKPAPVPVAAPAPVAAPPPAPVAAPAPVVAPPPAPVVAPQPMAPIPVVAAPVAPAPVAPPAVVVAPEMAAPVSQTREKPPVPAAAPQPPPPKRRVRGDELISVLFESMHDLNFLRDSIEGGDFCLQLALEKLPSRVALVYLYDIDHREFVVVCAQGAAPQGIIGRRLSETESLLAVAMRKRRAILLSPAEIAEHAAAIGGAQHMMLAPVMQAGRFLGAIEIADPSDGVAFSELDANAITYMAEQYAEFVAARGVLLDRERSSQPPAARTQ